MVSRVRKMQTVTVRPTDRPTNRPGIRIVHTDDNLSKFQIPQNNCESLNFMHESVGVAIAVTVERWPTADQFIFCFFHFFVAQRPKVSARKPNTLSRNSSARNM